MAGPGGVEVGRAALKVLPDLTGFLTSLERFIQRIERQVVVQLPTVLDSKGVRTEIEKIRQQIDELDIPVSPDTTGFEEKVREKTRRIPGAQVPIVPDTDTFSARVNADVRKALASIEADIPLTADGERLRRDVQAKVRALQEQLRSLALKVPLDAGEAAKVRAEIRAKVAELQAMVRMTPVEVPITADTKRFDFAALGAAIDSVASKVTALGRGISSFGSPRGVLFGGLALSAAAAVQPTLALAASLAEVAKIGALIPAAVGGAVGSLAALIVGLHGFGDALKAMGDPKKFSEALKDLAPNAQAAARALKKISPALTDLRKQVQDSLFAGMSAQIEGLAKILLPALQRGLSDVASAWSRSFGNVARILKTKTAVGEVSGVLAATAKGVDALGKGIASALPGLLILMKDGATILADMFGGLGQLGARFSAFIANASQSGALRQFFADGLRAAKQLGSVFESVGKIVGNVFSAATAGGGGLGALADFLERVAAATSTPAFKGALAEFFGALATAAAPLKEALPAIADAIVAIAPGLGSLAKAFGTGLGKSLETLAGLVERLAPGFNSMADSLSRVDPNLLGLGVAAITLAGPLGSVVAALGPVVELIGALAASPVGAIVLVIAALAAAFVLLYTNSQPVRDAVADLGTKFQNMWTVVEPILGQLRDTIMTHWPEIQKTAESVWTTIQKVVSGAMEFIGTIITQVTANIQAIWSVFGPAILSIVDTVFPAILQHIQGAMEAIQGVVETVLGLLTGDWTRAWEGIKQIASGVWQQINAAISAAGELLVKALSATWESLKTTTAAAWEALKATVTEKAGQVVAVVKELPGKIVAGLGNIGSLLVGAGMDLIRGFIAGITSMARSVAQTAASVVGAAVDAAKSALKIGSPSKVFMEIGGFAGAGLRIGLENSGDRVAGAARSLALSAAGAARVRLASAGVADASSFPSTVILRVGDREFASYVDERATATLSSVGRAAVRRG